MSNILDHLFNYLPDVSGVSDIINHLIIQQFDISSMSDVLIHLINYLSDISGVSDIVNYVEYSLNIGSEYEGKVSRLIPMILYTTDTLSNGITIEYSVSD